MQNNTAQRMKQGLRVPSNSEMMKILLSIKNENWMKSRIKSNQEFQNLILQMNTLDYGAAITSLLIHTACLYQNLETLRQKFESIGVKLEWVNQDEQHTSRTKC